MLDYPSVWPLVLLPLSLGLIVACARWRIRLVGISALRGGAPGLNLARLTADLQARCRRPVLWLLPRGSRPFSQSNLHDSSTPVYSEAFRHDFLARFELREQSDFYDLYFPRPSAFPNAA